MDTLSGENMLLTRFDILIELSVLDMTHLMESLALMC